MKVQMEISARTDADIIRSVQHNTKHILGRASDDQRYLIDHSKMGCYNVPKMSISGNFFRLYVFPTDSPLCFRTALSSVLNVLK